MVIQAIGSVIAAQPIMNVSSLSNFVVLANHQDMANYKDTVSKDTVSDVEQVKQSVDKINKLIQRFSPDLQISIDSTTKEVVVKVKDKASGELIRQIPSEVTLHIARTLDSLRGVLLRETV